jgi:ADP-ribosyl-[dinitrogen reductase] hydrolase
MLDKIKGALFGLAIGDALGGTTEFLSKAEIERKYGLVEGIIGGGVWNLKKGETTDDTAMTLAVARGILKDPANPIPAIVKEFLKWYASKPKDIGCIIETVLRSYNGDWFETAKKAHYHSLDERSAGNGSLMRCLPIALAYHDLDEVETITRKQSKMTHYDYLAEEACVLYNRIAFYVLHGKELNPAIKEEIVGTTYESALTGKKPTCPPDGFVVNTMHWVLHWLLTSDTYRGAVVGAANEGNDSDTVAAIAGGLAGLACGFERLPSEFCEVLIENEKISQIAIELSNLV